MKDGSRFQRILSELKRRSVFKVAGYYVGAAFVLLQLAEIVLPAFIRSNIWAEFALRATVLLTLLGFPIAIVLAWVFDITPQGLQRTEQQEGKPLVSPVAALTIRSVTVLGSVAIMIVGGFWVARAAPDVSDRPQFSRPGPASSPTVQPAALEVPMGDPRTSIAVLPFESRSPGDDRIAFTDGIQEDILAQLSKLDDLRVLGRSAVLPYRGEQLTARQIGQELGVETILQGSVRWQGDQIRISTQLIDTQTEEQLWAETFDRTSEDVLGVQTEVAQRIAEELRVELSPEEEARIASAPTRNVEAFRAYRDIVSTLDLRGDELSEIELDSLLKETDAILALDSAFSSVRMLRASLFSRSDDPEEMGRAEVEFERAMADNPDLAATMDAVGVERFFDNPERFPGGENFGELFPNGSRTFVMGDSGTTVRLESRREGGRSSGRAGDLIVRVTGALGAEDTEEVRRLLEESIRHSPGNLTPYIWEVQLALASDGDIDAALEATDRAFQNVRPDRAVTILTRNPVLIRDGNYRDILRDLPLREGPGPRSSVLAGQVELLIARAYQAQFDGNADRARGHFDEALSILDEGSDVFGMADYQRLRRAEVLAQLGEPEEALALLEESTLEGHLGTEGAFPDVGLARSRVLTLAGREDEAIRVLEQLVQDFPGIVTPSLIRVSTQWDALRDQPRFQQLIRAEPQ